MTDESTDPGVSFPADADVDAVILEFKGDVREAIRALLHDVAGLAADYDLSVSRGYVRRALIRVARAR